MRSHIFIILFINQGLKIIMISVTKFSKIISVGDLDAGYFRHAVTPFKVVAVVVEKYNWLCPWSSTRTLFES